MKECDVIGCSYPVFGTDKNNKKRYCKKHQFLRTDISHSIKRKNVQSRNEKLQKNKYGFDPFQWGFTSESEMFDWIWTNRPHKSEISGLDLNRVQLFYAMFAHILSKNKYPLFRYNPENILLVLPVEHVLIDQGSASARRKYLIEVPTTDFSIFYNKKIQLENEYPKGEK